MISIRTKLIFFMCLLVVVIDTFTCLFFLHHSRKEQEGELKKLGNSLVVLLANDTEVYSAITYSQPAFLDNPIKMLLASDRDEEVGYWRVMNTYSILSEGKAAWNGVPLEEIPPVQDFQAQNTLRIQRITAASNETFFHFSIPVFERQFSEEVFATQLLGEDKIPSEVKQKTLGFVQIGLSTRRINKRLHEIILYGVIPMALGILIGGVCITFVLNKHIVTPLQRLAGITLEVAKGGIGRTVDIRSKDEIGQLAMNFNQMTRSLEKSYESLRTSENKYRTLLENLPQRIFYKDKELRYISCNQNYAGDLNVAPDEIIGKTDYDFYPRELAEKYRVDDRRILETKQVEDIEEKYIARGREMFIHTVKTPVRNAQGDVVGILGVFWDITEKVALQMESVRTRHLVALGELAAGVAHEINNPINGIINCAQILIDKSSAGSEDNDLATRVIKEGNRIANIVSSLLSFARSGDGMERMQGVNLDEALAETLTLVAAQFKKENIILKVSIPQNLPAVTACPQQIQQVFLNIISNARYALCQKYPNSHTDKMLEVVAEEGAMNGCPCVRATFYDHGIGIPANIMDKVKDPFFTSKPRGKGTGLGLSISHGIISDHGGKLLIESIEGEFTKVAVVLPAAS